MPCAGGQCLLWGAYYPCHSPQALMWGGVGLFAQVSIVERGANLCAAVYKHDSCHACWRMRTIGFNTLVTLVTLGFRPAG